jgi:hypothetical protein
MQLELEDQFTLLPDELSEYSGPDPNRNRKRGAAMQDGDEQVCDWVGVVPQ